MPDKTKVLIKVDPEFHKKSKICAVKEGLSFSGFVRALIKEHMDKNKTKGR